MTEIQNIYGPSSEIDNPDVIILLTKKFFCISESFWCIFLFDNSSLNMKWSLLISIDLHSPW